MEKIILYIDTLCRGGAERVMANLANEFIHDFAEVIMVNDFIVDPKTPQYNISEEIRRYYLRGRLNDNLITKNIKRIINLRKFIREEKPDIVLSFKGRPNIRMLIATVCLPCIKIVSVRNDPTKEYGDSYLKRKIANVLFGLADGVVFQTHEALKYFSGRIQKKSTVIWNPVADVFYNVDSEEEKRNIISVGRLEPQKNQVLLIDAFAKIALKYPDEKLLIYGEGSLRNHLQRKIEELDLSERIMLCGDKESIENALGKGKIFVLPSDYEGMPNALLEAMAVGLPCIATDCPCGGPKEIVENGTDGILVPPKDIMTLAEAINDLELDDDKRKRLGDSAKRKAEMFRPDSIYRQWMSFMGQFVSK